MQERDMILLLELVDDLLRLNEAIKNLGGLGYQERFPKLDNVYEVIKANSVFRDCKTDEGMVKFYRIVDASNKKKQEKMETLLIEENK